jgi:ubiquinone/menaquinone biosynthesis C-methylase UbiE
VGRARETWDALAARSTEVYVGDPAGARRELDDLFARLGADPRGGRCVEVGCGPGRMTPLLAERFDAVLAVDVSPAMLEQARVATADLEHVELRLVSGERLDGVDDASADFVVCYLVLQHLPRRATVTAYLEEIGRVLVPGGEVFVQLPLLETGVRPRLWRAARSVIVPLAGRLRRDPAGDASFRGVRLTEAELDGAVAAAGLSVVARDEGLDAPYRYSRDRFLRLRR